MSVLNWEALASTYSLVGGGRKEREEEGKEGRGEREGGRRREKEGEEGGKGRGDIVS